MSYKVAVALSTFAQYDKTPLELLKNFDCVMNNTGKRLNREEVVALCRGCDGVIAGVEPYDDYVLDQLPELRCISRCGVGIDNIDLETAGAHGIKVFNTPDAVIQPVAELTIAMAFDLLRKLSFHTELLRNKNWKKLTGWMLYGKQVGVLGLGRIGRRVAEIFSKLDARVYGADLNPDKTWAAVHNVSIVPVDDILKRCDIVTIHLAGDKENPFCLGREQFALMKNGALVINTSRGKFLDEDALYECLKSGHLAGAALDVFREEPYSGKLCELDTVVLTPHVATLTVESRASMELEAVQNLIREVRESVRDS
jgi:D-3-phosphoglycerate dehydrogenase